MRNANLSILLVEDNPGRIGEIQNGIKEEIGSIVDVHVAENTRAALKILRNESFDVIVCDLMLPEKPDGEVRPYSGMEFLNKIYSSGRYCLPSHIVGITYLDEVSNQVQEFFDDHLWYLVKGATSGGAWSDRLISFLDNIARAKVIDNDASYGVDIFIMTAVRDVELEAVRKLPFDWEKNIALDDIRLFDRGKVEIGGSERTVSSGAPARQGLVHACLYAQRVIEVLRPRLLLMVGYCAGVSDRVRLGDIIAPEVSWEWQSGKHDGVLQEFQKEPYQICASPTVIRHLIAIGENVDFLRELYDQFEGNKPDQVPRVTTSPLVSGSSVVADERIFNEAVGQHRKTAGLDMEVYGVFAAASFATQPRPEVAGIKAVSDLGDAAKNDSLRSYCAYLSARCARQLMESWFGDYT